MAVLTRDSDVNEEIIKIDDAFDTFFTNEAAQNKINKSGDSGMINGFDFTNAIVYVRTPPL
jgi:hypothetical protein